MSVPNLKFTKRQRAKFGLVVGGAVIVYLVTINAVHGTPVLGILLIIFVGALAIPFGIWISGLIWKAPEE